MSSSLLRAVKRGDLIGARNLLKSGADPNEGRRGVSESLWAAAHRGNTPIALLLLEAGAQPTWEIVHAAAFANHANTLRVLLASGAQPDPLGATMPLLNALKYSGFTLEQQSRVRQLLHDAGARELPDRSLRWRWSLRYGWRWRLRRLGYRIRKAGGSDA
jgi:hypothetical protein